MNHNVSEKIFPEPAPDFGNILRILDRGKPERPTLFEFFMSGHIYAELAGRMISEPYTELEWLQWVVEAFRRGGYDYATSGGSQFRFPREEQRREKTRSLNEGNAFYDRDSFERYIWPDPEDFDYSPLEEISPYLPRGMKLIVSGPSGLLENVVQLTGYNNLCMLLYDNASLAAEIFDNVGSRLKKHYELAVKHDTVGALMINDDWGFKTQTMLSPGDMKKYVIPWHKELVTVAHDAGKPAIMHSCGRLDEVMDDIIDEIGFDGKHSYEDNIQPVEQAYEQWSDRIAVMGGIDVDFICRKDPEKVYTRSAEMIARSAKKGAFALGSGNSIPDYVPDQGYFAMVNAVLDKR